MTDSDNSAIMYTDCLYELLDNGIHKLTVVRVSRKAVDEFITHNEAIFANCNAQSPTVRILVDSTVGVLPMGYLAEQVRRLLPKYSLPRVRYVSMTSNSAFAGLVDLVARSLRITNLKIRNMVANQEPEAIMWLLADD